jgi:hypothetical protein
MASYIEPIRFALIVFPFLALAISSVFFIYEYRKYGTFLVTRAVILYSFVFYLLCAYFLVILPLPAKGDGCPNDRAKDGAAFICFMATFQRQHGIGLV